MGKTFLLTIANVTGALFEGEVLSVMLPGSAGDFTVLREHAPLVATLREGTALVRKSDSESETFSIPQGAIAEVSRTQTTILL